MISKGRDAQNIANIPIRIILLYFRAKYFDAQSVTSGGFESQPVMPE